MTIPAIHAWCQRHTPAECNTAWYWARTWYEALPDGLRHPGATALLELAFVCIDHGKQRTRRR